VRPVSLAAIAALVLAGVAAAQQQPARAAAPADSARRDSSLRIEYRREVFSYQGGARDPFRSLITSSDVRPTADDLRLVSVIFDARGNSVAVVRENGNDRPYRLRRGDQVGRLRVVQIRQTEVVFQVEEFGFERQVTLALTRPEARQ
jgi:hypothetical protein